MDNVRKNLENLKESLESNTELNNPFNKKLLEVVNELFDEVEAIQVNLESVTEDLSLINDDLSEVQEELFEEVTFEELEEYEDEYIEIKCSNCNNPLYVEKSALDNKESLSCPYCTKEIQL